MYQKPDYARTDIYDFILSFGGHLDENNRCVILRRSIDWKIIHEVYEKNFDNKDAGNVALSAEIAFGSLYIQRKLSLTDRELVDQISENPYMQYFIGFKEFSTEKPFDPSLLVTFRKRLTAEMMEEISETMFLVEEEDEDDDGTPPGSGGTPSDTENETGGGHGNSGTLIIDVSCASADIAYPTDLELCDRARKWTETILDHYWKECGPIKKNGTKPRTYRKTARRRFLSLNKRRKKTTKKIRKELRYQLGCIRRNLGYIRRYEEVYGTGMLHKVEAERLQTVKRFEGQQRYMLENKIHSVEDRIVSLSQPWIRSIVRGKSKAPTEFGAKISISVVNGYTFIDKTTENMKSMDIFVFNMEHYMRTCIVLCCAILEMLEIVLLINKEKKMRLLVVNL